MQDRHFNRRSFERFDLAAGYTSVTASDGQRMWGGHAYDVSEGGALIELDESLPVDSHVELALHLPGERRAVEVAARVVRVRDADDEFASSQVAVAFDRFETAFDRQRLCRYLGGSFRTAA